MKSFVSELIEKLGAPKVRDELIMRYAYAGDAGFYYMIPLAIVFPDNEHDIAVILSLTTQYHCSVTFRCAGTSLSGQTVTDGLIVDLSKTWNYVRPLENGEFVEFMPGVTGAVVNHVLRKMGRKIGPDPASIKAAMMGGILSNNASGMCCGVSNNAYHTLHHIRFILPNGATYDTSIIDDYNSFLNREAALSEGLAQMRSQILQSDLAVKIRRKYTIKNTVGYALNAFLDYEHPLDIFSRLLIGAEGTLGFISKASLRTIEDFCYKKTGLLFFPTAKAACEAVKLLVSTSPAAMELMDRSAIRSIEQLKEAPNYLKDLPEHTTALLVEYQAADHQELSDAFEMASATMRQFTFIRTPDFSEDQTFREDLWKLRKGMYPSVAAVRAKSTTVLLEDIAVPISVLSDAITGIQHLFVKYAYSNGIIFGHAKDGNLHFVVSQAFDTELEIQKFAAFNRDLVDLIVHQLAGSIKAEHGTGRQVAAFVAEEWGEEAYEIMKKLKQLADPHNILNRGVLINSDPASYLTHLKTLPVVEAEVDKCVECGFCEAVCPSRNYTLTPRQRIMVRRAIARERNAAQKNALLQSFNHYGLDTCAVDGMCATECPVQINTGDLVKRLRRDHRHKWSQRLSLVVAARFRIFEYLAKGLIGFGQNLNTIFGKNAMSKSTLLARKWFIQAPLWDNHLVKSNTLRLTETAGDVLYFPGCITRIMGGSSSNKPDLIETLRGVSAKAGLRLIVSKEILGTCCGQAFGSKGFEEASHLVLKLTLEKLWKASDAGKIPILMDISSCFQHLIRQDLTMGTSSFKKYKALQFINPLDFAVEWLIPNLRIAKKKLVVFHPVCSSVKAEELQKWEKIGRATSQGHLIPKATNCCGMAGDRGFYYPELIESATREIAEELNEVQADGYYSCGKTCEMALQGATQRPYESIFYLLDEVSIA